MENQNNEKPENVDPNSEEKKELPKIKFELSKVAANPKQSILIAAIGMLFTIYFLYSAFKEDETQDKKPKIEQVAMPAVVVKPSIEVDAASSPILPTLPKAPELKEPSAPKSTIAAPSLPSAAIAQNNPETPLPSPSPKIDSLENVPLPMAKPLEIAEPDTSSSLIASIPKAAEMDPETLKRRDARKKSSIMLIAGAPSKSVEQIEQDASFKLRSNLKYVLSRGKVIDAVLESAVNTDFAGEIRAVVSRDVFSESGKVTLIPKGSRVFGNFSSSVDSLYGRVEINWERIDLPTGYTLTFAGTGIDDLGRKGSEGRLDTKAKEKIGNSILSTALQVGFASALDKLIKPQQTSQQATQTQGQATSVQTGVQASFNAPGTDDQKIAAVCAAARAAVTDTTSATYQQITAACAPVPVGGTPATPTSVYSALMAAANTGLTSATIKSTPTKAQLATEKGMKDFSKTITDILEQATPKPTVTINQGTNLKIYVNKDYTFPRAAVTTSRVL